MPLASTAIVPSTSPSRAKVVAVIAPYGNAGRHAQEYTQRGWECIAVTFTDNLLPPAHRSAGDVTGYQHLVEHSGGLRLTLKQLRYHTISAVVAGSGLGVELADRLARDLRLPGNDPKTSLLRCDRGAQAAALADAGLAAPRSLRTDALHEALQWAEFCHLPAYAIAPADSSAHMPPALCHTKAEIEVAWRSLRRAAHHHTGTTDLVLQEHLPGRQYIVHTVSDPASGERTVTEVWAERRTSQGLHDRSDLVTRSLLGRSVSLYAIRAVQVLGVESGPARCRIVVPSGRGPALLSARAYSEVSPGDDLSPYAVRAGHLRMSSTGTPPPLPREHGFASRVSLIAPREGTLDGRLLRTLTTLPTVARVIGTLVAGTPVQKTVDRASSPAGIVLSAASQREIAEDYRAIRAMEALGLYDGAAL